MSATDPTDDPTGIEVGFGFEISAGVSSLREEMRRMRRDLRRQALYSTPRSRRETMYGQPNGQFPASGNLVLTCDGPQQGKLWDVRQIIVAGPTITSAPPGTGYVFAQTSPPNDLSSAMCRDFAITPFPAKGFYSSGQFRVQPAMNLYMVIVGGATGTTYVVYVDIEEWDDTRSMATVNDV